MIPDDINQGRPDKTKLKSHELRWLTPLRWFTPLRWLTPIAALYDVI
jgi:hypothetical protein